ncbi:MAG: LeuD/DmdB family oxidoreductase small subunit [Candidatus Hodarchaeales archaeon]|jgi:3-isopropylmalate/(R)-2-methylmalate dehydratase small subunit
MNKETLLKGKAIVIKDTNGKSIDDIDTDMIFHNKHLHITNINEMGQFSFGNLPGWEEFPNLTSGNDFLIVGENFGAGSSRQQAVDCFRSLGVIAIIGESFGAIYKRNAINSGLPLIIAPKIMEAEIKTGDELNIDLTSGKISNNITKKLIQSVKPLSNVQIDIYQAGNLFEYGKSQE